MRTATASADLQNRLFVRGTLGGFLGELGEIKVFQSTSRHEDVPLTKIRPRRILRPPAHRHDCAGVGREQRTGANRRCRSRCGVFAAITLLPFKSAGVNVGAFTPSRKYRPTANYDLERIGFDPTGRSFGARVYDSSIYQAGCPVSTVKNRTINDNYIPGIFTLDASPTCRFDVQSPKTEAFLFVRAIFDKDPVLVGNGATGNNIPAHPQTNRNLYNVHGRAGRMGLRVAISRCVIRGNCT